MAAPTTVNYGPNGRNANYAQGEFNFCKITGPGTEVMAARGSGLVHAVVVGVAGTLLKLYDVASGGTLNDAACIAVIDLSAPTTDPAPILDAAFNDGLTAVVTGAATVELTITGVWGRTTRVIRREFPRVD